MKTKSLFGMLALIALTLFVSSAFGINPYAVGAVLTTVQFIPTPQGAILTAIKVTDLNTKLGAYLREYQEVLISEMLLNQNFEDRVETWDGVTDEIPLPNLTLTDLVKPGQDKTFAPTADALTFDARILKVNDAKVDLLLKPYELHKTWLGKFKQKKGADPFDMPFEEYIFQYIIQKVHENIHIKGLFKGVYNGAGSTSAEAMTGFLKHVVDGIAAGTNPIVPITTGVITSANVADKLLTVYDGLGEAYKEGTTQAFVAPQLFDWYVRKFSPITNAALVATDSSGLANMPLMNRMPLHGTNCVLVREAGLTGSQRVIITPKENMIFATDSMSDFNNMEIQKFDRTLKLMMDFRLGTQFKQTHSRALAVNEQV